MPHYSGKPPDQESGAPVGLTGGGLWTGLEFVDFFRNQASDAVFDQVNLAGADVESFGNFLDGPLFENIAIKNLKMLWLDLAFHALQRPVEKLALPLRCKSIQ